MTHAASAAMTEARARAALEAALADVTAEPATRNAVVRGVDIATGTAFVIDFVDELATTVRDDVIGHARRLADGELIPYDPSFQPSPGQALVDALVDVPQLARLQGEIAGTHLEIDRGSADVEPQVALAHRVDGPDGRALTAYRVTGPGIATRRPRGIEILLPRHGVWEPLREELIYYQPRFDALVVDDVVFVTAPTVLQRRFGSDERARTMARQTFKTAVRHIDIEGSTDLADAVASDPAMIAKMAQLNRTLEADPGYAEFLTTRRILEFLDDNPQIPIATAGEGQARHLVFETSPQKRYLIPKTLADDFLRSELTNRHYEAGSKQRID